MSRERNLVLRAQSGDRAAFDELLRAIGRGRIASRRARFLANVARLSPASRAVVTLHYLDEMER